MARVEGTAPAGLPELDPPRDEAELEERLSRPDDSARRALEKHPGDVLILGAGGKMGPRWPGWSAARRATAGG